MRREEFRCAELLKSVLQDNGHGVSYDDGLDPPDIAMTVDGG